MDAPYFPFYPADWLSDPNVQQLTLEESGAYITLLAYMWRDGKDCTLPDDDKYLSRLLHVSQKKWSSLRRVLIDGPGAVFRREDGRLTNKRLDTEWKNTTEKIQKNSQAAKTRWNKGRSQQRDGNANAMQTHSERIADASQTHMRNDAISDPESDPDQKKDDDDRARGSDSVLVEGVSGAGTSPTVNPYAAVEQHMQMRMVNPKYICRTTDYQAVKRFLEKGVPIEFIINAIDTAFAEYQPKFEGDGIKSFTYCARVVERLWSAELAKNEFRTEIQVSATRTRDGPKQKKRDERYAAFYQLYPDA